MNKVNLSSMRVLQMLRLLFEKSYTMNELVDAMSELTGECCTNFLISKYINTCRFCGIDIQKLDGKYTLLKIPFGYTFSEDELELLSDIGEYTSNMRASKTVRNINSVITKINQHSDKYYARISLPENDKRVSAFEEAIEQGYKVRLTYLENGIETTLQCEPFEITYDDYGLCFVVYAAEGERLRIPFVDISGIWVTKLKATRQASTATVTFILKDILAKRYILRPGERVANKTLDTTAVVNSTEDKATLLTRLLRYGELCEIKFPISYRKELLNIVDNTLKNYE